MKIVQVVPWLPESAGPTYTVSSLCRALLKIGVDAELHTCLPIPPGLDESHVRGYPWSVFPHPRLRRSPQMFRGLCAACKDADCIVNNSLWMFPNIYPEFARRNTRAKHIIFPRGTLSAWALNRSRGKKFLASRLLGQRRAVFGADLFVATAVSEYREIRDYGITKPVAVISNGIHLPDVRRTECGRRGLVFLSRIHEKKGVDILLNAWRDVQDDFPDWDLKIAGPITPYAQKMIRLASRLGVRRCEFTGGILGREKDAFLADAECLVLPTHSENFGMVVAEALSCGTPVICSKGAPWASLETNRCGWWIDIGVKPLIGTLREVLSLPPEALREMGERGRAHMARDFSWEAIARKLVAAIDYLHGRIDKPDFVRED